MGSEMCIRDSANAGQAFRNIAKRIMGEEVPIMDLSGTSASNGGFFNSLMKLFKRG